MIYDPTVLFTAEKIRYVFIVVFFTKRENNFFILIV